jgi:hypothetical protein
MWGRGEGRRIPSRSRARRNRGLFSAEIRSEMPQDIHPDSRLTCHTHCHWELLVDKHMLIHSVGWGTLMLCRSSLFFSLLTRQSGQSSVVMYGGPLTLFARRSCGFGSHLHVEKITARDGGARAAIPKGTIYAQIVTPMMGRLQQQVSTLILNDMFQW